MKYNKIRGMPIGLLSFTIIIIAFDVYYIYFFLTQNFFSQLSTFSAASLFTWMDIFLISISLFVIPYGFFNKKNWARLFALIFILWLIVWAIRGLFIGHNILEYYIFFSLQIFLLAYLLLSPVKAYFEKNTEVMFINENHKEKKTINYLQVTLLIATLIVIFFGVIIFQLKLTEDISIVSILLTTISTGLATVLAIILTATLVVAQLASRYSPLLLKEVLLKSYIFPYLIIFVIGVIFPLIALASDLAYNPIWFRFSLILPIFCLVFLFPYLVFLNKLISPKNIINELYWRTSKKLRENSTKLPIETTTIQEMAISLWDRKSYEDFHYGIKTLGKIMVDISTLKIEKEIEDEEISIGEGKPVSIPPALSRLLYELRQIEFLVHDDPIATFRIVEELGNAASNIEVLDIPEHIKNTVTENIIEGIEKATERTAKQKDEATFERFLFLIGGLAGKTQLKGSLTTVNRLFKILRKMFNYSIDEKWFDVTSQATSSIYSIGKISLDNVEKNENLESIGKKAIEELQYQYITSMNARNLSRAAEAQYKLKGLGTRAQEKKLEGATKQAISSIMSSEIRAIEELKSDPTLEKRVVSTLGWFIIYVFNTIDNFSRELTIFGLEKLTKIGLMLVQEKSQISKVIIEGLGRTIALKIINKKDYELLECTVNNLISLAEESQINEKQTKENYFATLIAAQFWRLGGYTAEKYDLGCSVINSGLDKLKPLIGKTGLDRAFEKAKGWEYPPPGLDEFREIRFRIS